jgi:ribosomal protein L12E/L44/L45/RPP1/RPP2
MAHAKVVKHTAKDYAYTIPSAVKTIITELDTKDIEEQADQLEATESIDITPVEEPKEIEAPAEKAEEKKKAKAEQKVEPQLDLTEMPNLQ